MSTYVDSIVGLALPTATSKKGKEKEVSLTQQSGSGHVLYRIHCHWEQTKTATGRLSSAKPNMQNLPKEESYLYTREGTSLSFPLTSLHVEIEFPFFWN